jgi:hypothetical protein
MVQTPQPEVLVAGRSDQSHKLAVGPSRHAGLGTSDMRSHSSGSCRSVFLLRCTYLLSLALPSKLPTHITSIVSPTFQSAVASATRSRSSSL